MFNHEEKNKFRASKVWKEFRKKILIERNYTCEIGGLKMKKKLNLHHMDEANYTDLKKNKFAVLSPAEHKLIERLLRRKNLDIDLYCRNLKRIYKKSKTDYKDGGV